MKVYVVQADNFEAYIEDRWHWTEGVFSSKELAEQYIEKEEARYDSDIARIDELNELYCNDRITDEEYSELSSLQTHWRNAWRCCPHYWIDEYEMT